MTTKEPLATYDDVSARIASGEIIQNPMNAAMRNAPPSPWQVPFNERDPDNPWAIPEKYLRPDEYRLAHEPRWKKLWRRCAAMVGMEVPK